MPVETTTIVQTVLGPVPASELGRTLIHEHIVLRSPGLAENYPSTFPRAQAIAVAVDDLQRLRDKGVQTFVDMTTVDIGRDVELLAEVSSRSGMHIVATSGVHRSVPTFFHHRSSERIAEMLIGDLLEGVAGTGVRAGVLKCAVDVDGMTPAVTRIVEAVAIAHKATGVPISTHTTVENRAGLMQQEVFKQFGVAGERVDIGHSGDSADLDYLRALLAYDGCYLGMDRFGLEHYLSTKQRCEVIAQLCREGFASRLMLSHDAFSFNDATSRRFRDTQLPSWRFDFIIDDVLPRLQELGVTDEQIHQMLDVNPARFLGVEIRV